MKRDMDLVRELLLTIEGSTGQTSSHRIALSRDDTDEQRIGDHLRLMQDGGLIHCRSKASSDGHWRCFDIDLTWEGHEFLDTLRDPDRWEKTKGMASKVGGVGLKALLEIGKALVKGELQKHGLPIG